MTNEIENLNFIYSHNSTNSIISNNTGLQSEINNTLSNLYSKTIVSGEKSIAYIGVFRDGGSCGNFKTLHVFMDSEDGSDCESEKFGWTGDSYVDGYGNIHLYFCLIDAAYTFYVTNVDYGVLWLGSYAHNYTIIRDFDNEDGSNSNSADIDGVPINGSYYECSFDIDTRLVWYYYPKDDAYNYTNFPPSLGICYGVLGRFGCNQGFIYSDDEDNNNANGYSISPYHEQHILEDGINTRLYFSKASKCTYP
ncbi:MAG: hypothetical protein A2309_02105 [Bacteroidetes bacterium RIFOXYB2_FULL_35_7]|nr:MAG: hypothetical protein A2X01_04435 [Bacteroidetes bacterium GWF2_35_48]OFY93078.1 MAG: hypothetical protein A2491_01750 [Bacteroidetes bacterium RIFOXYC12_FULL_35_7]OFY96365.1 MAG: hypothetical protein A2309_02105 [Bacteroidetes bacterium RIFOXYB2_FULL_35_7]HBX53258.1 hypothetical protein [Bacteroidales bacterium]